MASQRGIIIIDFEGTPLQNFHQFDEIIKQLDFDLSSRVVAPNRVGHEFTIQDRRATQIKRGDIENGLYKIRLEKVNSK